jgi:hypothetical protein
MCGISAPTIRGSAGKLFRLAIAAGSLIAAIAAIKIAIEMVRRMLAM